MQGDKKAGMSGGTGCGTPLPVLGVLLLAGLVGTAAQIAGTLGCAPATTAPNAVPKLLIPRPIADLDLEVEVRAGTEGHLEARCWIQNVGPTVAMINASTPAVLDWRGNGGPATLSIQQLGQAGKRSRRPHLVPLMPPSRNDAGPTPERDDQFNIRDWTPLMAGGRKIPDMGYTELTFRCMVECWDAGIEKVVPVTVERAIVRSEDGRWESARLGRGTSMPGEVPAGADLRLKVEVRNNERHEVEVRCEVVNLGSRTVLVEQGHPTVSVFATKSDANHASSGFSVEPD